MKERIGIEPMTSGLQMRERATRQGVFGSVGFSEVRWDPSRSAQSGTRFGTGSMRPSHEAHAGEFTDPDAAAVSGVGKT